MILPAWEVQCKFLYECLKSALCKELEGDKRRTKWIQMVVALCTNNTLGPKKTRKLVCKHLIYTPETSIWVMGNVIYLTSKVTPSSDLEVSLENARKT